MRLLALRLRHFRRFGEAVFTFDPRLNILVGPNEAGKSTLRHAILTALFVNPATTSKRVMEWRPWGSESLGSVVLEFEVDGRRYELRKDFEHRRAELRDVLHGLTWEGTKSQERVLQALGLATEDLYRATAMISQAEIALLGVGATDIGTRLSRIVQAGPGDAEAGTVIKRLDKDIVDLERGLDKPAKNPGGIKRLQDEVAALEAQQSDLQRRIARLDEQREELRRIKIEVEAAARDLRVQEAHLRENQDFLIMEQQLEPLRAQERQLAERLGAIEKGYAGLSAIRHGLEALQAQGVPDDAAIDQLHTAGGAVHNQRKEVERQQGLVLAEEGRLESLSIGPRPSLWSRAAFPAGGLLLLVGILAGILGLLWQSVAILPLAAAPLLGAGIILVLGEVRRRRRLADLSHERETSALRLEERRAALTAALDGLHREEDTLRAIVATTGSTTVDEAESRHRRLRDLLQEQTAVQSQVEAHLGARTPEELQAALDEKRADVAGREVALTRPEVQAKRITQLQVQQLEHDVKDLTQKVHRLQERQDRLERETAEGAPDYEALVVLQERLVERQEMLEAARRRALVSRAVREGLQTARQDILIPARRLVEQRAGEYLSLLTLGAYDRVQIEEPPLRVAVWVPQANQWMEPAEPTLSRGTADQVYLAVRLALVEVLAEGCHPPLLLDDPFGTFDPPRLQAAMAMLRRVSEVNQVLLFTCRPEYEPFADRVIPLAERPAPPEVPGPLWQQPPPRTH